MRSTVIVWARDGKHSEQLARQLGATIHFIHWGRGRSRAIAALRMAVQAAMTWWRLVRERPAVVVVQNPAIFAVLTCWLYAQLYGARLAISSGTGAFLDSFWAWSVDLHRALSRRSAVTILHNRELAARARGWGAPLVVLGYVPDDLGPGTPYPMEGAFTVATISTMSPDEPLEVILEAAAGLPDVHFYVTGRSERMPAELRARMPANCHLTGYLAYDRYVGLLRGADAVLDLTTREETVLMGGFEAIAVGTPLITSDWPTLRSYFRRGTVHVPNTVDGLRAGVERARRDAPRLRQEIAALRAELEAEASQALAEIRRRLGYPTPAAP